MISGSQISWLAQFRSAAVPGCSNHDDGVQCSQSPTETESPERLYLTHTRKHIPLLASSTFCNTQHARIVHSPHTSTSHHHSSSINSKPSSPSSLPIPALSPAIKPSVTATPCTTPGCAPPVSHHSPRSPHRVSLRPRCKSLSRTLPATVSDNDSPDDVIWCAYTIDSLRIANTRVNFDSNLVISPRHSYQSSRTRPSACSRRQASKLVIKHSIGLLDRSRQYSTSRPATERWCPEED